MRTFCNYAVLRFQPFPQTGEFANLGIVMLCSNGDFEYKIESKQFTRITQFFNKMDRAVFFDARKSFAYELERIASLMEDLRDQPDVQREVFKHLIGPSATIFRFSNPRTIASDNPKATVRSLFETYVLHKFDAKPDSEAELTRKVGQWLTAIPGRAYEEISIGDNLQPIKFPFGLKNEKVILQVIKPISFDLKDASKILDKGSTWLGRLDRIRVHNLAPQEVVFVSKPPKEKEGSKHEAYLEVVDHLQSKMADFGTKIIPVSDGKKHIVESLTQPIH